MLHAPSAKLHAAAVVTVAPRARVREGAFSAGEAIRVDSEIALPRF
jgi:hypothetical protein